ncbi:hypothetical protein POMI540_4534 [Schizosaccharomyces pombe]|uniref:UPF0643 protein PB2B2.08 n=1 Tax=Schizosaccharomyces pombe (strain 972 / ATCC 24843) TaxID=284812 RepID=YHE8_SCHPO|nr:uncharacterized protein SPBPB2B2.08 [Schizosaccharomyces pombe]Q9HDU7.1 RecName: Full=UPF0643 protein PB2B2.08 [Schizosaccharomyces pombe 972h-]CAC21410.1 conserved fungal protein [Schizosaccharomyces pombe]|eukprot:NP_596854.1 uncharacterized protein SPBPB2B2.08 [Schizosaccharomyces pombe]
MIVQHKTAKIEEDHGLFQPILRPSDISKTTDTKFIQSSPYIEKEHWLDLGTLSVGHYFLSLALQTFVPKDSVRYAHLPYAQAFDIAEIVNLIREYSHKYHKHIPAFSAYIVAFRSVLQPEVQVSPEARHKLAEIDKGSHLEANVSGGLLKYWYGIPDDVFGQNLATCWWTSKESARLGGAGKIHREGLKAVRGWYKNWKIEEYELEVIEGGSSYIFKGLS